MPENASIHPTASPPEFRPDTTFLASSIRSPAPPRDEPFFAQFGISGSQWGILPFTGLSRKSMIGCGSPTWKPIDRSSPSITGVVDRLQPVDCSRALDLPDDASQCKRVSPDRAHGRDKVNEVLKAMPSHTSSIVDSGSTTADRERLSKSSPKAPSAVISGCSPGHPRDQQAAGKSKASLIGSDQQGRSHLAQCEVLGYLIISAVLVGLCWGGVRWYNDRNAAATTSFKTVPVARGNIVATITTDRHREPEIHRRRRAVQGRIIDFGKDNAGKPVDNNSEVAEGMVLAHIDPSVYESTVDQMTAQLGQAQAGVERAQADLGQFNAAYQKADRDWARAQKLGPSDALAQADYDTYESAYETGNLDVGKAAIDRGQSHRRPERRDAKAGQPESGLLHHQSPG